MSMMTLTMRVTEGVILMAMEAKYDFIRQAEARLSAEITAADLSRVMAALSDVMEGFDLRAVAWEDTQTDDLLDSFTATMKVQGRSQKTIDRYVYVIRRLMAHAKVSTRRISVYHLRAYLAAEKERGICDASLEGYRQVFSAYFNWLFRESLIEKNPTANLGPIRVPKKQKKTYTEIDLEKLKRECETPRDRALIGFLASTGCRVSEAVGLNRDQVDLEKLQCVVHGKGNKERTVYLDAVTGMLLRDYLLQRTDDHPALFYSMKGNRMAPGSIRHMLNVVAERAGVEHVHPHKFRRTLATNLARRGMPIQTICRILGHENIKTSMEYVMLNDDDIKTEYRRYA